MDCLTNAAMQAVELKVSEVLFVGICDNSACSYPLAKCRMSMEVGHCLPLCWLTEPSYHQ